MPALQTLDLSSGFRNAMRRFATTVSVVSCVDEDGWHGMTATAVTAVCTDPPALLVCVNKATAFYGQLSASGSFCISLLRSPHVQISQAFGGRLKGVERFERGNWTLARHLPCLIDAQANLFCKIASVTHFGTHVANRRHRVALDEPYEPARLAVIRHVEEIARRPFVFAKQVTEVTEQDRGVMLRGFPHERPNRGRTLE
jgi:flavin reductase